MINHIIFKSILVHSICIVGTLFLAVACSNHKKVDSKAVAEENIARLVAYEQNKEVVKKNDDAEFLMKAAEMQLKKISLAKLAQLKGSTTHVRELSKMCEEDHIKIMTGLKALASSKSVSIPISVTEDSKETYKKLGYKSGDDFDKTYCDMMVVHHANAIELFENAAIESKDAEIRDFATNILPALRVHLRQAETCNKQYDKIKS